MTLAQYSNMCIKHRRSVSKDKSTFLKDLSSSHTGLDADW